MAPNTVDEDTSIDVSRGLTDLRRMMEDQQAQLMDLRQDTRTELAAIRQDSRTQFAEIREMLQALTLQNR